MLSNDLSYYNETCTVEIHPAWEFKSCNFQYIFLNWIFSVIYEAKITKFGTCVVDDHSEGTVSRILYLGPSFYFMKSRKLSCQKIQKVSRFLTKKNNK